MDPKTVFFTGIFLMVMMAVTGTEGEIVTGSNTTVRRLYHFLETPKTWSEAQSFCRVNYADLATVDNMEDHMRLMESIGNADVIDIWIGLERVESKRWLWSEGIGVLEVYKFNVSPDAGHCVWMALSGYWYADNCSNLKAFLCFKYDSNGTESYILNTKPMSWRDAQSFCRQNYTDLVSVKTKAQNREVYIHANSNIIWIGLFRDDWVWSDRSAGSFRKWHQTNPNNLGGDQNCVAMRKDFQYLWDDSACYPRYPFVCYGELKTKRTVVKVKISSEVNLSHPTESDSLLKQFQAQLEKQGLSEVKIRCRVDKNEQIFH